jgi:hypothetical protein
MNTWTYFYIVHTIKNGKIFRKESGWGFASTTIVVHLQYKILALVIFIMDSKYVSHS